ncbi:hypothetical protein MPSEU_000096600 [Mayamaea pseudoterrestris]|nr:hypothetical protein MPSEU_000096600 [Mayamaea pseudoterrestris]
MTAFSFPLHPQASPLFISLVEEHMALVVREAVAVNHHCKRARQHPDDGPEGRTTAHASNPHGNGAHYNRSAIRRRLHAADVNMALQLLKCEQLYATNIVPPNPKDKDTKILLQDFLQRESAADRMPLPPSEVGMRKHWLAVDGVQPQIPQNPSLLVEQMNQHTDGERITDTISLTDPSVGPIQVQRLQSSMLSEELLLYYVRLTTSMERGGSTPARRQDQDAVLASLAKDGGLQELVPFFVRYLQQEIYKHYINNVDHARTLMRMVHAVLSNPHLHLELHLHELLPALMTCVVSKRPNVLTLPSTDMNDWALRRDAAFCLVYAANIFGQQYVSLKARILKSLCEAAAPTNESLASRYGGFVAASYFGDKTVDAFLLPTLWQSWREWEVALSSSQIDAAVNADLKFAVQMCQRAAIDALAIVLRRLAVEEDEAMLEDEEDADGTVNRLHYFEMQDTLGDRYVALQGHSTEYTSCFI